MSAPDLASGWRIRRGEEGWPECLAELPAVDEDEPEVLYGLGARELLAQADPDRTVTIVGSRRSGAYGREVARELGFGAASAGPAGGERDGARLRLGCARGRAGRERRHVAVLGGPADVALPALEGAALPPDPGLRRRRHLRAAVRRTRSIPAHFPPATGSWPRSPASS